MCLAIPGQIETIDEGGDQVRRHGRVRFGGIAKDICLAFVPEAQVGDYVIVHVGFALSVVDESEARKLMDDLKAIEALAAEENPAG